jgi:hypothetical protein
MERKVIIKYKSLPKKYIKLMAFAHWIAEQFDDSIGKDQIYKLLKFFETNAVVTEFFRSFEENLPTHIANCKEFRSRIKQTQKHKEVTISEEKPTSVEDTVNTTIEDVKNLLPDIDGSNTNNDADLESEETIMTVKSYIKGEWVLKSAMGDLYHTETHEFIRNVYDDDDDYI